MTGTFVALEGAAGTGKSTLLDALADELRERGESVTTVPEFADGPVGEFVAGEIVAGDDAQFRERALADRRGACQRRRLRRAVRRRAPGAVS